MLRRHFSYELPPDLIAQQPSPERRASRLLTLDGGSGALADRRFAELPALLRPGDLLVLNDTRVLPARLTGYKATGGQVEVLIERLLDERRALAQVRASKSPKPGMRLHLEDALEAETLGRDGDFFELDFGPGPPLTERLERHGHMPLPPYIERADNPVDRERYQTVFAAKPGAVAAPTAGLHFDAALLEQLAGQGIERSTVTLHVGAGTYQPMRADRLEQHHMHAEWLEVSAETCAAVERTRAAGGRVVAVGTTAVRSLETAAQNGRLQPYRGDTRLFLYPGQPFRVVDALITNFHLPESTLLMLVCAFAGWRRVLAAYEHAVERRYRFFSYGDAMFITRNPAAAEDLPK